MVKVDVTFKLGIRKVGRARELVAKIDHSYEQVKAQTGKKFVIKYFKRP